MLYIYTIYDCFGNAKEAILSKYMAHFLKPEAGFFFFKKGPEFFSKGIKELFNFHKIPLQTTGNQLNAIDKI